MLTQRIKDATYRYPKIVVNMTDQDIIDRVANLFGTSVYVMPKPAKRPNTKPQWRAQASGLSAAAWMVRLYPWLGARRRGKIDEILAEYRDSAEPNERRRLWSRDATTRRTRNEQGQFVTEIA
jgi:hypothetical protein